MFVVYVIHMYNMMYNNVKYKILLIIMYKLYYGKYIVEYYNMNKYDI